MALFFLSDVHLSQTTPSITAAFLQCLQRLQDNPPEALFILGDLFDAWLGDKLADDFAQSIAQAIQSLSQKCPVFFQRGNRDFLLGAAFCQQAGMTLLPDIFCFDYAGKTILITHGDLLCTQDKSYQRLRRLLRHRYFYRLAKALPLKIAQTIAAFLRQQSKQKSAKKSIISMDVSPEAVEKILKLYPADYLIHGHTHRPAIARLSPSNASNTSAEILRITLGDWRPCGEVFILPQSSQDQSPATLSIF